jgi:hypothetical protein
MPTSKADRINKLFESDSLPPSPDPQKSHIADTEIISKTQPAHESWTVPTVAQMPRKITKSPPRMGRDMDQLTSSDDDEYIRAFKKTPKMKADTLAKPRTKTPKSSGHKNNNMPRARVRLQTGDFARGDADHHGDDGISTADKHGHPLLGRFCSLTLVTKFCYKYMDDPNDRVSKHFFAAGKVWNRRWDM